MSGKRKKNPWPGRVFTVLLAAVMLSGGVRAWLWLSDNKIPNVRKEVHLYVRPDTESSDILSQLDSCVTRRASLLRAFKSHAVQAYMKPGHYLVQPGQTSAYISRMLNNGWQTPVRLVIPGARLKDRLAGRISAQMMVDSLTVLNALNDKELLGKYGFTPETAFAFFMPDTYEMYWTASMDEIFARQEKAYEAYWTGENVARARRLGLSRMEVSILASIVKGESRVPDDYAKIAGVYLNRLKSGMKLQADPTIAFLLNYETGRILKKDLKIDSPYNTYLYYGLPPGPICIPDKAYLDAVLNPDTKDGYLYFCAAPSFDGTHRFAKTYSEHLRNARAFQQALDRRKK